MWLHGSCDGGNGKNLPGGESAVVPPDPMPNSEVKRRSADGSVGSPHARVGNCQASPKEPPVNAGGFLLWGAGGWPGPLSFGPCGSSAACPVLFPGILNAVRYFFAFLQYLLFISTSLRFSPLCMSRNATSFCVILCNSYAKNGYANLISDERFSTRWLCARHCAGKSLSSAA